MTNTKHTPGPWKIFHPLKGKYRGDIALCPENGPAFVYLAAGRQDIQEANARLIAAAPELLAALQSISDLRGKTLIGDGRYDEGAHNAFGQASDIARAAISKATGEK